MPKRKATLFWTSGTGFSEKEMRETIERLKPLFADKPAVENPPKIPEKIQWVKPKLVCEVAFAEWTEDEQLRQTSFLGWRDDKRPEEAVLELQQPFESIVNIDHEEQLKRDAQ